MRGYLVRSLQTYSPPVSPSKTHVRVYVDGQDIYDPDNDYVDFYKTFSRGGHTVVTIAWDADGQYIKASSTFIVN